MNAPAVFFDRDGTLIRDAGYLRDPSEVELLPGVVEILAALRLAGFKLVVISNQSGIGRGLVTEQEAASVDRQFQAILHGHGIHLDATYYCPHSPEVGCDCRKPAPGLLHRAANDLRIDLNRSWMIGDKTSDIEAGERAGCRTMMVRSMSGTGWWQAALSTIRQGCEAHAT